MIGYAENSEYPSSLATTADCDKAELTVASIIKEALRVLQRFGTDYWPFPNELQVLLDRLEEERFHLAVLGQFKRGKSTVLNALLGADILPTSIIPLTAIPTFLEYGSTASATVMLKSGEVGERVENVTADELRRFLEDYVTEEHNPNNYRGIQEVWVNYPSTLLQMGVVLIDTPGIGSTYKHNTQTTLDFLSQCDAALFVTSPEPPVTEIEIDFLNRVVDATTRVFLVVNKIDYITEGELEQAVSFVKRALKDHAERVGQQPIFCVSARVAMEARIEGDLAKWARSGMERIESELIEFLSKEKRKSLETAVARKAARVISEAIMQLEFSLKTLRLPTEDLERRLQILGEKLAELRERCVAQLDMLEGDRKRARAFLEEQASRLRKEARTVLRKTLIEAAASQQRELDEVSLRNLAAEEVPKLFDRELARLSRDLKNRTSEVFSRHKKQANDLVESIYSTAAELFEVEYPPSAESEWVDVRHRPYWVTHEWSCTLSLLPAGFFDSLLPARVRKARALRRLEHEIDSIVGQNVENVRWPSLQNLEETFRKFGQQIENQYNEAARATRGAIEAAYTKRREQAEAVDSEAVAIESALCRLKDLRSNLERA